MHAIASNLVNAALAEVQHAGDVVLFPMQQYWWFYAAFTLFVLAVLALDLGVFHRQAHEVKYKEAVVWSAVWITLALLFNLGFWFYTSWKLALPECAEPLASSAFCPVAMYHVGDHIFAMQAHPEFSREYSRDLMEVRRGLIGGERIDAGISSLAEETDAPRVARWIVAFLNHAWTR